MNIQLLYFDGCPNWQVTRERLHEALRLAGRNEPVDCRAVSTLEQARAAGFPGSPTVLIDGRDPFAVAGAEPGLACRLYRTPAGMAGAPTVEQLVAAIGVDPDDHPT